MTNPVPRSWADEPDGFDDTPEEFTLGPGAATRPVVCHFPAGDRCGWCRDGHVHFHQSTGPKVLYRGARRDPDPAATLTALGLLDHPPTTFGDQRRKEVTP